MNAISTPAEDIVVGEFGTSTGLVVSVISPDDRPVKSRAIYRALTEARDMLQALEGKS